MPIRLSGMVSGMDTDSIIKELVSSYRYKTDKYKKEQTKLEWKQDAWKELNNKIYKLYSTTLSNLRSANAYNRKKTTVSDENKASVIAKTGAAIGTQTLEVKQLATQGYLTGGKLNAGKDLTSASTLSELGITNNGSITIIKGDGTSKTIGVTSSTTVGDFVKELNEAGLNASFDETNQRFFITSKSTGAEENFTLFGDENGEKALSAMRLTESYQTTGGRLELVSTSPGADSIIDKNTTLESLGITSDITLGLNTIDATTNPPTVTGATSLIALRGDMTVEDFIGKLKSVGFDAGFDEQKQNFYINSSEKIQWIADPTNPTASTSEVEETLKKLKLWDVETKDVGGSKVEGTDAKIILNGAEFEGSSNTFTVNNLTITAKAKTDNQITLSTETDVDSVYNTIKDFFKQYNELIKEMDTSYNAASAKGYEPLTDDEKEAMSDVEIEKWEKKIKDSLFRRDNTLSDLISSMKSVMQSSFEVNGKKYSLSSFGIKTASYFSSGDNEKGIYHIDGDKDDSTSLTNEDKLKSMIASEPDTVASFFGQLVTSLYDNLTQKMSSTSLSSAFTVYNDKQMKKEYDDYDKKIDKWEKYVTEQEEYWYSKFTAMEKALSQLQSSTSALSGLLGS